MCRYPLHATARNLLVRILLAILAAVGREYDNSQPSDAYVVIEKGTLEENIRKLADHAARISPNLRHVSELIFPLS